jgi:S1-C subfamily serine protease
MSTEIENVSAALQGIVVGLAPSIVSVISHRMQASGFVWRPGLIVTSDEGLAEEGDVHVLLPSGERVAAQIAGRDPRTAVALLKVEGSNLRPVALAAAIPLPGGLVVAVGAEAGAPTAAFGMVSVSRGSWQSMRGGEIDARVEPCVSNFAANPADGDRGYHQYTPTRSEHGHAERLPCGIHCETALGRSPQPGIEGRILRGYLGLGLQPVTVEGGGSGIMVMSVDPKGPGAAANIHQGDVLVSCDGKLVSKLQPLLRSLGPDSVGKLLTIELRRGGQLQQTKLQIGERPTA